MQNQNGTGGQLGTPMKRIRHSTVIEEPHGYQNGPMGPPQFSGFLQNMIHPAFRGGGDKAGMHPQLAFNPPPSNSPTRLSDQGPVGIGPGAPIANLGRVGGGGMSLAQYPAPAPFQYATPVYGSDSPQLPWRTAAQGGNWHNFLRTLLQGQYRRY
jgi:hypothetical protein